MSQASGISPEVVQNVSLVARALLAAARNWAMYPPEHPAVRVSLERLSRAIADGTVGAECSFGVTPETLVIKGEPLPPSRPIAEAARFLHDRDILRLDFAQNVTATALHDLLKVLTLDAAERREQGGPAAIWARSGHPSVSIEQIDYRRVLEDRDTEAAVTRRDDIWQSIVKSIVFGQLTFDEIQQRRLLEIAGDPRQIGELTKEALTSKCTPDGSPMIATQAATVIAAFRHLANIVSVMEPERVSEVMKNLAESTSALDPNVVLQVLQSDDNPKDTIQVVRGVTGAFDDLKVARLLATALAVEGRATNRLAEVFNTIAPDAERRERVLQLTRDMLGESDFGRTTQFKALWASMESLLLSYDDKPYMSDGYRTSLDNAGARAETMAARDLPPELGEWMGTLGQDNVRQLSVTMMIDLLRLEADPVRGEKMANDLATFTEDLLLSGDFESAQRVTAVLAESASDHRSITNAGARRALDTLAHSAACREVVGMLGDLDAAQFATFCKICGAIGVETVEALSTVMFSEAQSLTEQRAGDIIVSYGAPAVLRLAPLVNDARWFVQRNGVLLLDRIAAPEAVPLLQPLLRKSDPRVAPRVVAALAGINDPAAARAIHMVLRAATGDLRQAVINALVEERDPRVVPMLVRILQESEPFGADHTIVLETMGALATVAGDRAVRPIATLIRRRRWLARAKSRALKRTGVNLLMQVGSPSAQQALEEGRRQGDRLLRRIIAEAQRAGGSA